MTNEMSTTNKNTQHSDPHGSDQFKPNTTVAAIVVCKEAVRKNGVCNKKFLLVEERDQGETVFNQPAGHIESKESLVDAMKRELKEETGLSLSPQYLCGIYYYYRETIDLHFLRFCFVIEVDSCLATQPEDDEIIACHWLTMAEIVEKVSQLRSPLVLECIEDYLSGKKIPLSHLKSNL